MAESIQKKLLRVRPPRVRITYDVETGGAMEKRELPFIVGVLADLSGDRAASGEVPAIKERRMTDIDRDKFNDVMKTTKPGVSLTNAAKTSSVLGELLKKTADKVLTFECLDDFEPLSIVQSLPSLNAYYRARGQIRALQARLEADDSIADLVDAWLANPEAQSTDDKLAEMRTEILKALAPACADPRENGQPANGADADPDAADGQPPANGKAKAKAKTKDNDEAKDKGAQLQALVELIAKQPADTGNPGTGPSDDEVAALKKCGFLAADFKAPKKPDDDGAAEATAVLALACKRARSMIAALSEENTQANRVRAYKMLANPADPKAAPVRSTAEQAMHDAMIANLGAKADEICKPFEGLDLSKKDDALWPQALLLLGCAYVEPDAVDAKHYADAKAYQEALLDSDERGRMLDFVTYLSAQPSANPGVAEKVFALLDKTPSDPPGKSLLRLHYFATEVLANLQGANGAADEALQNSAKRGGAAAAIDQRVVQIDQKLSLALSDIMHSTGFQQVEATWRGLAYLVFNTETSTMLKLRVFNATQAELLKDMEKAVEFDQSTLFKLIYEKEYGSYGGTPYSLLVGDYRLGSGQADIDFLKKIAEVAAAGHAPFIAAASENLFSLTSFANLDKPRDLKKIFESQEMAGWREFREMEDARYVSLALPRVLMRLPYGQPDKRNTMPCEGLNFEEQVSTSPTEGSRDSYPDPKNESFLWGNPAYVLAQRITNAFAMYSWTAAIRGVEGGGLVEGLPLYTYTSDSGMTELFCPTEVAITDRREKELNDLGFISLCHCKGSGKAAFFGGQSTNQPKKYFSDDANANAKISAMLPYILAASRFAHYIKVIMRDKIGSFLTRGNIEAYLNTWIANYVLLDDNATQEVKSSYPLRSASVRVTEVPGEPGTYRATVFLKPHFQLEELTTSIRLVANLPK